MFENGFYVIYAPKRKAGDPAGAEVDLAAAAAISPRIAEEYAPYGVRP
jgi:hypothetical protein